MGLPILLICYLSHNGLVVLKVAQIRWDGAAQHQKRYSFLNTLSSTSPQLNPSQIAPSATLLVKYLRAVSRSWIENVR
jgi:hypothetical protein